MAVLQRLRCTACGALQNRAQFSKPYEGGAALVTIGGRGRCAWEHIPQSLDDARMLRESMRAALARLESEIAQAERG